MKDARLRSAAPDFAAPTPTNTPVRTPLGPNSVTRTQSRLSTAATAAFPVLSALILAALDPAVSRAAQIQIGTHNFTVPTGFTIEAVSTPELAPRPVSAGFDTEGNLYVTDSSGSSKPPKEQWQDPQNRILKLIDTDGDGKFDKQVVFADKIGFVQGCLWHQGSVYAAAPPSMWKFTDADGDGVAETREEWFKQGVVTHCGNDIHGPYAGLDGFIYWTKGAFEALNLTNAVGKKIQDRAVHIFRARPDLSGFESIMSGGMDNPVEVDFTPTGEAIFTSTFMDFSRPGTRDGLGHASYGSVFGKVNDVNDGVQRTGDIFLPMTHFGPGAPSGICRYRSQVFGETYRDNIFATTFNLHKVTRHVLRAEGATFRTSDEDFVVSDNIDFHPTDVLEDADGSLLIVDTGGWYKLCCPSSQLAKVDVLGGIYRVRKSGDSRVEDPRGLKLKWDGIGAGVLARRLEDPRPEVRARSIDCLARMGSNAVPALDALTLRSKSVQARQEAIWALSRISGDRAREGVRQGMNDAEKSVKQAAIKAISLWRDAKAVPRLLAVLEKGDPSLASVACEALGRIGNKEVIPALLRFAERLPSDRIPNKTSDQVFTEAERYLEHAVTYALIGIADPVLTSQGLLSAHSGVRRVSLIALDQMENGGLKPETIAALLHSTNPVLQQTAVAIAGRHPEWGGALAGDFQQQLQQPSIPDSLATQIALFARDGAVQEMLATQLQSSDTRIESRQAILKAMAQSGVSTLPASWVTALARVIGGTDEALVPAGVQAARALPQPKVEVETWKAALTHVAENTTAALDLRLDALAALTTGSELPTSLFQLAVSALAPDQSVSLHSAAVTALTRAKLTAEQYPGVVEVLKTAGPLETTRLIPVFDGQSDEALGLSLIGALKASKSATVLRPDMLKPRLNKFPDSVQKAADELLASLDTDAAKQRTHLDELLAGLKDGDVRRGQQIFNSPKAACASCHKIGYLGGLVGPDLTKISEVRSARDLLEAIVYPSASFVRSFEPMIVATRGGEEFTGILRKDGADEVVLVTGPGAEQHIARSQIAELRPGTVSVMPQGLDQQLTPQELADLVAFLKNTKWGTN